MNISCFFIIIHAFSKEQGNLFEFCVSEIVKSSKYLFRVLSNISFNKSSSVNLEIIIPIITLKHEFNYV